jgi:thiol-disulfide isomerase/thioredoxin
MKALRYVIVLLVVLGFVGSSRVQAGDLGDPAPALQIAKWIKGDAVDLAKGKGKKVYVVEFWATWCPPCRTSIPHLSEVAKKYRDKGLVIIGVTNETDVGKVSDFVEKMGDKMDYVVAQDDGRKTSDLYMKAFNQRGIPHAFVVDKKGLIVWHGHPMANLDQVVADVLAGKHSVEKAKADAQKIIAMQEKAKALRDYFLQVQKTQQMGDKLLAEIKDYAPLLNELAWGILTNKGIRGRDLDLALRVAKAAYDASEGKNAAIVDTYARALFDTGEKGKAIELQRKAVELSRNDQEKAELQKTLDEYIRAITF